MRSMPMVDGSTYGNSIINHDMVVQMRCIQKDHDQHTRQHARQAFGVGGKAQLVVCVSIIKKYKKRNQTII